MEKQALLGPVGGNVNSDDMKSSNSFPGNLSSI